jgi:predicted dehydrogenase
MSEGAEHLGVEWRVKLGNKTDYGIGLIGCGGVVQYAHMPAYKKANFNVVGAYDINREAAEKVASEFNIPKVYDTLEELLDDPAVEIVDIAVPPWLQLEIVKQVVAAGKHMLCQKPLADTFADAVKIVELAEEAGLKQAVNHQMRWDAGIAASRDIINRGLIGIPTDAQIQVSCETAWHMWPWLAAAPQLEVMYHSIHYLDAMRSLFRNPRWVTSRHARFADQDEVRGETKTITVLDYPSGLQAMVAVNHYNIHAETFATFHFLGTGGAIDGTIGLMYNYPEGRPDTLVYSYKGSKPIEVELDEMWIPDAFVGPMASLMEAIETDGLPFSNTRDNLDTLRVVHAAYLSAQENRSVRPEEIG